MSPVIKQRRSEMDRSTDRFNSSTIQSRRIDCGLESCTVCGKSSKRIGLHYGAISCRACRSFFMRRAHNPPVNLCLHGDNCVITPVTCRACIPCRYKKCLTAGMESCQVLNTQEKQEVVWRSVKRKNLLRSSVIVQNPVFPSVSKNLFQSMLESFPSILEVTRCLNTSPSSSSPSPLSTSSSSSEEMDELDGTTDNEVYSIFCGLDLTFLENLYEQAEIAYIEKKVQERHKHWSKYNMGPEVLKEFIHHCRNIGIVNLRFMELNHKQTQSRIVDYICGFDEISELNSQDRFLLLSNSICEMAWMYTQWVSSTYSLNEDVIRHLLGPHDFQLWKYSDARTSLKKELNPAQALIHVGHTNIKFIKILSSEFFHTEEVLFLMLSILLFDPEIEGLSNPELVATFRQQQIRMTRRYLKRCSYEDNLKIIQEYVENIRKVCRVEKNYNPLKNCFSSLQFIYYLFRL